MRIEPVKPVARPNPDPKNNQRSNNPFRERLKYINDSKRQDEETHQKSFAEMLKEKMDEGR